MNLSIILVSWNTAGLLAKCLASIYTHSPGSQVEIIVVDNASTDDSAAMVRTQFPDVRLIANDDNIGFAPANNQAIRQSSGDYILLLNPDTEIKPGALETLLEFMEDHPHVGAVGPHTFNPDGTLQTSCYPLPTLTREVWRLFHLDTIRPYGSYRMADWSLDQAHPVETLLGACLLIRREVLDQVGLLDEQYFIYSEEIDLCYRIQQAGWSLYWVPQAQIIHYGGQSTQQVAAEMFIHLYQSKLRYFRKHHGWLAAQVYKLILLIAALSRLSVSPLAWLEREPQRQAHLTLARNYGRLVRTLPDL